MTNAKLPVQENRRFVLANRDDPPIDALAKENRPPVDLLKIREQVIQYLESGTSMNQIDIAGIVGIRRETISAIRQRRAALSDVTDLNRLYAWMHIEKNLIRDLEKVKRRYLNAKAEKKRRLRAGVLQKFEIYPYEGLPDHLREFIDGLKPSEQEQE